MAARINPKLTAEWREKIKISMLINRLMAHVKDGAKSDMSPTQVRAAEILLRKALPDLQSVELQGTIEDNRPKDAVLDWLNGAFAKPAQPTAQPQPDEPTKH